MRDNEPDPQVTGPRLPRTALLRPLILGAGGKIGRALQTLWRGGHWAGVAPRWQVRDPAQVGAEGILWDILHEPAPDPGPCDAIIVLAGVTSGSVGDLTHNSTLALTAIDMARRYGIGQVLLTSTAAVYGPSDWPLRETDPCRPTVGYGAAKLAMERDVADHLDRIGAGAPAVTILRIGNVAGADQLLAAIARGPVRLDRFDDGQGPRRTWIGPLTLGAVLRDLMRLNAGGQHLPRILNVAAPGIVAMADILMAAQADWFWIPAPPTAVPALLLDTTLLQGLVPLDPGASTPRQLLDEARLAGWGGPP